VGSGDMAFIFRRRVLRRDGSLRAAKLLPFAAPLLGAGDETSGDDEASIVPLTVGHAASHAPSRRPRSPPVDKVWIGCAR
jgi:hypothetical protein